MPCLHHRPGTHYMQRNAAPRFTWCVSVCAQASEVAPAEDVPAQVDWVRTNKLATSVKNIKGSSAGKLRFEVGTEVHTSTNTHIHTHTHTTHTHTSHTHHTHHTHRHTHISHSHTHTHTQTQNTDAQTHPHTYKLIRARACKHTCCPPCRNLPDCTHP